MQREAGLPVAPDGLRVVGGDEHPAQAAPRRASAPASSSARPSPRPCSAGHARRTTRAARSSRGGTTTRSRAGRPPSSATQQPPRVVLSRCWVRRTQVALRSGGRSCGSGEPEPCDNEKHSAKSVLRVRSQYRRRTDRGRCALPVFGLLLSPMIASAAMSSAPSQ